MNTAHSPHPSIPRSAAAVGVALVAVLAASLLLVDWVVVPAGLTESALAQPSGDATTQPTDIGQLFYREKTMAPSHELPAQF
jgi:hypothetical protein